MLRVTPPLNTQSALMLYNSPLSAEGGLDMEFKFAMYGGVNPDAIIADGLSFFLKDGANTDDGPGQTGSGLGYALRLNGDGGPDGPGVRGALLGIGFDYFGNFSSNQSGGGS